jgi:hypothetical protein
MTYFFYPLKRCRSTIERAKSDWIETDMYNTGQRESTSYESETDTDLYICSQGVLHGMVGYIVGKYIFNP